MALASLQGLVSPAPLEVSVGGLPLPQVVAGIVQTLNEQQRQFDELRAYTYQTNEQQWARIAALEESVGRLHADVGTTERPVVGKATVGEALRELESRVATADALRKGGAAMSVRKAVVEEHTRRTFHRWMTFARLRKAAKVLCRNSVRMVQISFFDKWQRALRVRAEQRIHARKTASLLFCTKRSQARGVLQKWSRFAELARGDAESVRKARGEIAANMLSITLRSLVRRRFLNWHDFALERRRRSQLGELTDQMQRSALLGVARRAFFKWADLEGLHRRQRVRATAAIVQGAQTGKGHLQQRFVAWQQWTKRRHRRLAAARLVPPMQRAAYLRLLRCYYAKLGRNVERRQRLMQEARSESMVADVSHRCDLLGSQLDISVKAMSTTNQALAKVAHRLAMVERGVLEASAITGGGDHHNRSASHGL